MSPTSSRQSIEPPCPLSCVRLVEVGPDTASSSHLSQSLLSLSSPAVIAIQLFPAVSPTNISSFESFSLQSSLSQPFPESSLCLSQPQPSQSPSSPSSPSGIRPTVFLNLADSSEVLLVFSPTLLTFQEDRRPLASNPTLSRVSPAPPV